MGGYILVPDELLCAIMSLEKFPATISDVKLVQKFIEITDSRKLPIFASDFAVFTMDTQCNTDVKILSQDAMQISVTWVSSLPDILTVDKYINDY